MTKIIRLRLHKPWKSVRHSSGSSIRGKTRVDHHARKSLKTLLHLAAMSALQVKGELQDYYQRKVNEGKNKMLVINALRNNGTAHAAHPSGLCSGQGGAKNMTKIIGPYLHNP
jgi:hypothetical protein